MPGRPQDAPAPLTPRRLPSLLCAHPRESTHLPPHHRGNGLQAVRSARSSRPRRGCCVFRNGRSACQGGRRPLPCHSRPGACPRALSAHPRESPQLPPDHRGNDLKAVRPEPTSAGMLRLQKSADPHVGAAAGRPTAPLAPTPALAPTPRARVNHRNSRATSAVTASKPFAPTATPVCPSTRSRGARSEVAEPRRSSRPGISSRPAFGSTGSTLAASRSSDSRLRSRSAAYPPPVLTRIDHPARPNPLRGERRRVATLLRATTPRSDLYGELVAVKCRAGEDFAPPIGHSSDPDARLSEFGIEALCQPKAERTDIGHASNF